MIAIQPPRFVRTIAGVPQDSLDERANRLLLLALALALLALGIAAAVWVYEDRTTLAFNDAFGHEKIARFAVSGYFKGAAQLGAVWLPVQHVLMLPLIWNDALFRSGIAGAAVSVVSFVAAGLFIYLIAWRVSRQRSAGLVALVVFASNPNTLYMQSVPMTEVVLIATVTAGTYFLLRWATNPDGLGACRFIEERSNELGWTYRHS